ncbi:hypothetical protein Tco_0896421 [Tanacetum coccineum]
MKQGKEVHHEPGKVRKGKSPLNLIDEDEEAHGQALVGGVAFREPAASSITQNLLVVEVTQDVTIGPSAQPEDDTSTNMVRESSSPADAETDAVMKSSISEADTEILSVGEELPQGEEVSKTVTLEETTIDVDEGQAGSDPDPEPMHDDFVATIYPQVHEILKHTTKENVHLENPLSSSGTLFSMKNLDETFGDQFFNDKPTKEPRKTNVETEVESMVTVPIHQASPTSSPLFTPIIDLSPSKPVSTSAPELIFTATTVTTTTTLPLPQQQSSSDLDLASRVSALEQVCANFEKRHQLQDKTVQGLSSRVFTLELRDLPHNIDETVNEAVKEALQIALQALLKERFKDLSKANMKEILHDQVFESGSYRSQPEHVALYEALEVSMERDNRDEFLVEKDKSRKRRRDDQDPPPPPTKESKQSNKKKRHDSNASSSKQRLAPQSSAWKTSDTREAPSSSSKQNFDTDTAHLPKIKIRPDWLKPVPEEDRPETPEPDWIGKLKLNKADLEGPTYKVVKAFHSNNISLQFQMEEYHLLLTDQFDLVNLKGNRLVLDVGKPLPLGGPPGQVKIQPQFFFNKDLKYLVLGGQERKNALSISKLKAAYYLDFRLEELVPSLWIESEKEYDISATYGITHWWFKQKEFYITRHNAPSDHEISEDNFQNLHPDDFEDMYLLHLQGKLNHLSGADKVHLFNTVNLWIRNIIIRKQDYTIVSKPRAIICKDRFNQKKLMQETEVHKFSDGTLIRILEKLDHMVKDFKLFKYAWKVKSGLRMIKGGVNTLWSENKGIVPTEMELVLEQTQQDIRRSDTYTGNPVKEILLKLNLPDHRSVKVKMEIEISRSSGVNFITTCSYSFDKSKDFMKAQVYVSKLPQL